MFFERLVGISIREIDR